MLFVRAHISKARRRFKPDTLRDLSVRQEKLLGRIFTRALDAISSRILTPEITKLIRAGNFIDAAEAMKDLNFESYFSDVPVAMREGVQIGGRSIIAADFKSIKDVELLSFDMFRPRVRDWIDTRSLSLVKQIDADTREHLRSALMNAFVEQAHPDDIMNRIKNSIGLTDKLEAAVDKTYRQKLGETGDRAKAQRAAERHRKGLIKYRAEMIARTEAHTAIMEGRQFMTEQLVEEGALVNPVKTWLTSVDERTCEICAPLHLESVGLSENFITVEGLPIETPPAHPNCRCTVVYSDNLQEV